MTNKLTGTCPTCERPGLRLTKSGDVWRHRHPTERTASGIYRLPCDGGKPRDEPVETCPDCLCDDCGGPLAEHAPAGCACTACAPDPSLACTAFLPPARIALLAQQPSAHAAHHALLDHPGSAR